MPFSNENLLSPWQYYFSDKSFLTQRLTAWSDVGAVVEYAWDQTVPFSIKAGVFNSGGFSKQMQFQKSLNYVARGAFRFFKGFELTLNYAAVKYETIRMHNFDVGLMYDYGGLHLDAEYIYKAYSDKSFQPTHAFEGFACYTFRIGRPWLDDISLALRYDAITANCNGMCPEEVHQGRQQGQGRDLSPLRCREHHGVQGGLPGMHQLLLLQVRWVRAKCVIFIHH